MTKKHTAFILPLLVIIIVALAAFGRGNNDVIYQKDSGFIFGTSYNITYQSSENLKEDIVAVLNSVDNSLSPFNENSIITAINQNNNPEIDSMFLEVFQLATAVNKDTEGAFDITVAPLVNAWGFGFKSGNHPNDTQIDSIMQFIGFDKVRLNGRHIEKSDERTMLDCSAIAKGFGVDCVARMLTQKGIENFMVEIGGEIVAKGSNTSGKAWNIGVTKPTDDSLSTSNELQTVLSMTDMAMATSGNYRNFYYKGGRKYAHTIDPKTGYPVQHNILSATVIAENCAKADAYATAFMVVGLDKAREILKRNPTMKAYLIYNDEQGNNAVWYSDGLKDFIKD